MVEKYERMSKIGQGTFGEVFKARDRKNNKKVALKKVLMDNEKEGVSDDYLCVKQVFCVAIRFI